MRVACLAVFLGVLLSSCNQPAADYEVVAPATMTLGQMTEVSIKGSFASGDRIQWSATGGTFDGATDGLSAKYVAPKSSSGPVTVVCTIESRSSGSVVKSVQIVFSAAATDSTFQTNVEHEGAATPFSVDDAFVPSGFMGDAPLQNSDGKTYVDLKTTDFLCHSGRKCWRLSYTPGPVGWMAVAWQHPENNWGDQPGLNLSNRGFRVVTFWVRALPDRRGLLLKAQFKAGGGTDPTKKYQASFEVATPFIQLSTTWHQYSLDLSGKDLSQVMDAFTVVERGMNVGQGGATILLDDITYR